MSFATKHLYYKQSFICFETHVCISYYFRLAHVSMVYEYSLITIIIITWLLTAYTQKKENVSLEITILFLIYLFQTYLEQPSVSSDLIFKEGYF